MRNLIASLSLFLLPLLASAQIQAGFEVDKDTICEGDLVTFTDTSSGVINSWEWSFVGGNPATSNSQFPGAIEYTTAGTFPVSLTVNGPSGTSNFSTTISVGIFPDSLAVKGDTTIDMGGAAVVMAQGFGGNGIYLWGPEEIVNHCPECEDAVVTPLVTTYAVVEYFNSDGCALTDSVLVTIKFEDVIAVPNSFSPNDDFINDRLFVKGPGIESMKFRVFDRYGTVMFVSDDQEEGWDGTLNGQPLDPATLFWTLEYTLIDGTTNVKSGTVTLIK